MDHESKLIMVKMHGLETKRNAAILCERVDEYVNDPNYPLPFNERPVKGVNNLRTCWSSLYVVILNCMYKQVTPKCITQ